jgi:hypothetical protein
MKTQFFLVATTLVLLIVSCNKSEIIDIDGTGEPADATLYFPLTTGSYWIYQTVQQNMDSTFITGGLDSIYIAGDSTLNGNTYAVFKGSWPMGGSTRLRRDSSGYIVDQTGKIHFAVNNFTDTLYINPDTSHVYHNSCKMENADSLIEVPAGNFTTYDFADYYYSDPGYPHGSPRIMHNFYSASVGLVKMSYFFYSAPSNTEKRLVRFHIE